MGTLHDDQYVLMIKCHSFLLRMKNVSGRICREYTNACCIFNDYFFLNQAVHEIMRKNTVESCRPKMTI